MQITLTLNTILILAAIVLIVILSVLCIKLMGTIKRLNAVLDDASVITASLSEKTQDVDHIVSNMSEAVVSLTSSLKGNQNMVKAAGSLVNSIATFKGAVKKDRN